MFELSNPDWDKFRGNNREKIELPDIYCGGAVDLGNHIGKPLSKELWVDLVHRLMINGLCVYGCNQLQWTLGWGDGHCIIDLDESDNVERIHFSPHRSVLYYAKKKLGIMRKRNLRKYAKKKLEEDRLNVGFELEWYHLTGDDDLIVGNVNLPETTEDEVRRVFGVDDNKVADYLRVQESHIEWLKTKVEVSIDLEKFEYFVSEFGV